MMINNQLWICLLVALVVIGICIYFGYKYMYEYNLNCALHKQRSWKLPKMRTVFISYIVLCGFGICGYIMMVNNQPKICIQDQYTPSLMYEGNHQSLNVQLSQWIMSQNNVVVSKTDLKDRFEGIVGQAEDGNFAMFITYQIHGIEASDEVSVKLTSLRDGSVSMWKSNDERLENGKKLYAFSFASIAKVTCSQAAFQIDVEVKGHPELTASKKVNIILGDEVTMRVMK